MRGFGQEWRRALYGVTEAIYLHFGSSGMQSDKIDGTEPSGNLEKLSTRTRLLIAVI